MRKNLSGWVLGALAIAVTLTFMACKGGVNEPTPVTLPEMDDVLVVWGELHDAESGKLIDDREVYVEWYCISHDEAENSFIGRDFTETGEYGIYSGQDMTIHNGHVLSGKASTPGYEDAYALIDNFEASNMPYRRDYYMYPE